MAADFNYPGKYTFVDVEIPNINNDSVCAVSIIVIENGEEILRHTELIDPKTFFSSYNVDIHGITQKQVRHARTLDQFWEDYGKYFGEDYIIGAHNTLSDVSVLNKDLARYQKHIEAKYYVDTMDIMAQFYFKGKQHPGDLKLNNIARRLGIYIDHHNPESDVNACYEIIRYMDKHHEMPIRPFIKKIPEKIGKREVKKPHRSQMIKYLNTVRREISLKDSRISIDRYTAELRGNKAYKNSQWKEVILYYEYAIAKKTRNPIIYMRLARVYDDFGMYNDSVRILERGIRELKKYHINFQPLNHLLKKEKAKRDKPVQ